MEKYSYLIMDILFFGPIYLSIFIMFRRKIPQLKNLIIFGLVLGVIYFVIVDPFAVIWKAWEYNYNKTLGHFLGPTLFEEMLWASLAFGIPAILVNIFANKEEKKQKFFSEK